MNESLDYLTDGDKCRRMMDLSFSLYECLADLMADVVAWDEPNDYDRDVLVERIRLSAMNCTADMVLLLPIFKGVSTYGLEAAG